MENIKIAKWLTFKNFQKPSKLRLCGKERDY